VTLRPEERGEVLQQGAARAVQRQPIEEVPIHDSAAQPVDEARLVVELVTQPIEQIVEAPRSTGPVPLGLPDRSAAGAQRVAGPGAPVLELGVVETPDVAKVAGQDPVVIVGLIPIGEGDPGDGVAAEITAEAGDVEPGIGAAGLVHRGQMGDTRAGRACR
jgi:hypothetical protein